MKKKIQSRKNNINQKKNVSRRKQSGGGNKFKMSYSNLEVFEFKDICISGNKLNSKYKKFAKYFENGREYVYRNSDDKYVKFSKNENEEFTFIKYDVKDAKNSIGTTLSNALNIYNVINDMDNVDQYQDEQPPPYKDVQQ